MGARRRYFFILTFIASYLCFSLGASNAASPEEANWLGDNVLKRADVLDAEATALIKKGSSLRKEIKRQRQAVLKMDASEKKVQAQKELEAQLEHSLSLQKQGGSARKQATEMRASAVDQFATDMRRIWPQWVTTSEPIELSNSFSSGRPRVGAHNTRARSVHPLKKSIAGKPQVTTTTGMTLALPELSGQSLPAGLDTRSFAISRERQFVAHIEVEQKFEGQAAVVELNSLHSWRLLLSDVQGERVADATILFLGHMPGHVHGLPTQPRITQQLGKGVYRISGVKFQMRGWWVIELQLKAEGFAEDSIRFNLSL